jgi:hypothetical protein
LAGKSLSLLAPSLAEKVLKDFGTLLRKNPWSHLHFVVQAGMVQNLEQWASSACLGVTGAVDHTGDARMDKRSGAHGAGLDGGVHGAADEPVISDLRRGLAQGDYFSMRRGIVIEQVAVVACANNLTILNYKSAHRHFTPLQGNAGLIKGAFHPHGIFILMRGRVECSFWHGAFWRVHGILAVADVGGRRAATLLMFLSRVNPALLTRF